MLPEVYGLASSIFYFLVNFLRQGSSQTTRKTNSADGKAYLTEWEMMHNVKDMFLILVVASSSLHRLYIGKL